MKQTTKTLSVVFTVVFFTVALSSVSFAVDPRTLSPTIKDMHKDIQNTPGVGTAISLCADPAVSSFNVAKALAGNIATFTMTGNICNNGPADYNHTDNPLVANFNVYAGYGPMFSYVAAGELKNFKQTIGPILKKGQCLPFTQTYTRGNILQWGFKTPKSNEKQMKLMFEFLVRDAKGTLGTVSQQKSLDCNAANNINTNPQIFEMMIGTDML